MNLRTCVVLAAVVSGAWGQAPGEVRIPESDAPAEVNQALRERVNGFYQNHTGSVKRQGIDYVAEDTKDFYYSAKKTVYTKFELKKIQYTSKNFDRADVTVETTYNVNLEANVMETKQTSITAWKLEDGKWYWTRDADDPSLSPMSIFSAAAAAAAVRPQGGDGKPPVDLKNLDIAGMMAQQQRAIMQQSKLDRNTVEFVAGQADEQQVTLQNGFTGDVMVQIDGGVNIDGVTVSLDNAMLHPSQNAIVHFKYAPKEPKAQSGTVRLIVQPFGQAFAVQVAVRPQVAQTR